MEGCVKAGHLRNMRSCVEDRANWCEVVRLTQRRQQFQSCQGFQHITIQADGGIEFHAAVNDAVPDASDRCSRCQAHTRVEYFPCGSVVIEPSGGPCALDQCCTLGVLDVQTRTDADALNLTAEED